MAKSKNLGGRPRLFSEDLQKFRDLYLDPVFTPQSIIKTTGMSRASFYRYAKLADLPTLKVGISGPSATLVRRRMWLKNEPADQFDLEVARLLSRLMGAHFKIGIIDGARALDLLRRNVIDFSIGRMTDSKLRRKVLYFSQPYINTCGNPHGTVIGRKGLAFDLAQGRNKKHTLGVVRGSLHFEHATQHLDSLIHVRAFNHEEEVNRALLARQVDFRLTNTMGIQNFLATAVDFELKSQRFEYGGHTCIAVAPIAERWLPTLNRALEYAQDLGMLQALEKNFLRLRVN